MSLTSQDRKYMALRNNLTEKEIFVLNNTFEFLYSTFHDSDLKMAADDRVACLEAALVRFFIESREG